MIRILDCWIFGLRERWRKTDNKRKSRNESAEMHIESISIACDCELTLKLAGWRAFTLFAQALAK